MTGTEAWHAGSAQFSYARACGAPRSMDCLRHRPAKSFDGELVGEGLAVFFRHDGEAAAVIPHGPANSVFFERSANIGDPRGAILRVRRLPVHAEFVASDRYIPAFRPDRNLVELRIQARRVPVVQAITHDRESFFGFGN